MSTHFLKKISIHLVHATNTLDTSFPTQKRDIQILNDHTHYLVTFDVHKRVIFTNI